MHGRKTKRACGSKGREFARIDGWKGLFLDGFSISACINKCNEIINESLLRGRNVNPKGVGIEE